MHNAGVMSLALLVFFFACGHVEFLSVNDRLRELP
jgi:hypothetical protein